MQISLGNFTSILLNAKTKIEKERKTVAELGELCYKEMYVLRLVRIANSYLVINLKAVF